MTILVDTGFLLTLTNIRDKNHQRAVEAMKPITETPVISAPVLPELFYMVADRMSYPQAVSLFDRLRGPAFRIESLTKVDMVRMSEIMHAYADARFDFVDVAIMALAERLGSTRICTFDRRDFTIFRPAHCDAFELLP